MMAALSIVIDLVSIRLDNIFVKYTFYPLPLLLCGIIFGYKYGFLAGFVEGFISQVIVYGLSLTTPIWMLAPICWGVGSGLLRLIFKKNDHIDIVIIVFLTSFVCLGVNTVASILDGILLHYDYSYIFASIITRLITSLIMGVIYSFIIVGITPIIKKEVK